MEKCVFINGNQGNEVQSLTEMNFLLWSNDSSTLFPHKGNFENYGANTLTTNIICEGKEDSFRSKLPQKKSDNISLTFGLENANDFLPVEDEENVNKLSPKSTNKNIHLEFCATVMNYKNHHSHEIKEKKSTLNHSHILPFYSGNTLPATDFYMNRVVKYDGNCITGESKPNFSCEYNRNKFSNTINTVILNTFISKPSKLGPISCSLDHVINKHTEKLYLLEKYGETAAPMCYSEVGCNRLCKSLFSESMKLISIELMHTIGTHKNSAIIHNNKISRINLTAGNYTSKFSVLCDRNVIIKFKKVTPKINYHKTIKKCQPFSGLVNKTRNCFSATNCVKLRSAIHFLNDNDNLHNSVVCLSNLQANKRMLQCNYKPTYLNIGKKALSRHLVGYRNLLKYDPCVKKVLIKVEFPTYLNIGKKLVSLHLVGYRNLLKYDPCVKKVLIKAEFPNHVTYSGKMKNLRNIYQISTAQLYDKLSQSIKSLHERLESPSHFFAVKHNCASGVKEELYHQTFITQTRASCGNKACVSKSDNTELNYIIQKCNLLLKTSFGMNLKHLGERTNQYDRSVMSVSTQTDAKMLRNSSKKSNKTVGSQTSFSHMSCRCSEERPNLFSDAPYKRKIEALNLETLSPKKVFTYKYIKSDSVGREGTNVIEETNTGELGKRKGNNYCEPSKEEPKSGKIFLKFIS